MPSKKKLTTLIIISLISFAFLSIAVPEAAAAAKSKIYFTVSGFTSNIYNGLIFTIDGTQYTYSNLPSYFNWDEGSTHTIAAYTPFTSPSNQHIYKFSSWTNSGAGLTTNSGTYTVPVSDKTVTANYVQATHFATFAASGFSGSNDDTLIIDGTAYKSYNLPSQHFRWEYGSTHTVQALNSIKNYDTPQKGFNFSSWTNGNGLVGASGTFTMPNSDVTVTANYVQSTVQVEFDTSGLSNLNAGVTILTIDGANYDIYELNNFKAQWEKGSQHTITAAASVTGYDAKTHYFAGWSNGNGLTANTGTFTTPNSNVVVTVNYNQQSPMQETTLTVSCSVPSVDKGNLITVSGTLTSSGTPVSGKTISLTYHNGEGWISIGTATTAANGAYTCNWEVPASLPNGQYPVKATFAGDSNYLGSSAVTGSGNENGPMLFVTPENPIGGIVALFACFAAVLLFFKMRGKRSSSTKQKQK